MATNIIPNCFYCEDCGVIRVSTNINDGRKCQVCSGNVLPVYVGIDLGKGEDETCNPLTSNCNKRICGDCDRKEGAV